MERTQITCYLLCGNKAQREDGYKLIKDSAGASTNILVDCPECGEYVITADAQQFYFFPKDGEANLDKVDRKNLSDFVKKHYISKNPVILTAKVVRVITGK